MNYKCLDDLRLFLSGKYSDAGSGDGWEIIPDICPAEMNGDITVNCFRFAKIFRKNPDELARESAEFLSSHPDVEKAEKIKAGLIYCEITPNEIREPIKTKNKTIKKSRSGLSFDEISK